MDISCDVIRDLLPLYAEDLTSKASNELIDSHLMGCDACSKQLGILKKNQVIPVDVEVNSLKRVGDTIRRRRLLAVMTVLSIAVFGLFAIRTARVARSSFYSIGGCTAASVLVIQTILNCLGTLDILPFTGVTFPFVSNGGTSMIGSWGLLAFVKAADTRQNASFAVRLKKGKKGE